MASILDVSVSSDSEDDADYVPSSEVVLSDSSGDEDNITGDELESEEKPKKKRAKTKHIKKEESKDSNPENDSNELKVDSKKRADDIWMNFLNDVDSVRRGKSTTHTVTSNDSVKIEQKSVSETIPVKSACEKEKVPTEKIFEFAGETFTVANDLNPASHDCIVSKQNSEATAVPSETKPAAPKKRSGIDSVLGTLLNKKQKMTTLQKTLYDWKTFKEAEGLDEDLEKYNRGRGGFIERQRFLERSDVRAFEAEKSVRQSKKKK